MTGPALCLIDHPEARASVEFLRTNRGLSVERVFDPVGRALGPRSQKPRPLPSRPFIVVNGSGNFHHETALLVEALIEARGPAAEPLLYLQIDAHPDVQTPFRWQATCASFVGRILENPAIASVYLLGQYLPCLKEADYPVPCLDHLDHFRCDYFSRLHQYQVSGSDLEHAYFPFSAEALHSARQNPAVKKASRKRLPARKEANGTALLVRWRGLEDLDLSALPELPVYLTVDLDVARTRPVTDWRRGTDASVVTENQGDMEWGVLLELIRDIGRHRRIIGADFCGLTEGLTALETAEREDSLEAIVELYDALEAAISTGGAEALETRTEKRDPTDNSKRRRRSASSVLRTRNKTP